MAWLQDVDARFKQSRAQGRRSQVPQAALCSRSDTNARAGCFSEGIGLPLWKIEAMRYLNWIDQLSPVAALPSIALLFLIASILGWYVGSLIQWLRR